MAIDKAVENEYGAQFTYHKLREVRIINDDEIGVQLTLTVHSWINKQARIDGKRPTVRQCIIMAADFAMTPFYALLKAKFSEFAQGVDDFDNSFKPEAAEAHPEFISQNTQGHVFERHTEKTEEAADVTEEEVIEAPQAAEETAELVA